VEESGRALPDSPPWRDLGVEVDGMLLGRAEDGALGSVVAWRWAGAVALSAMPTSDPSASSGPGHGAPEFLLLPGLGFGVEEFGEAGVVGYGVEVGVGAGLEAVLGVEADGFGEVVDALLGVACHAGEQGEAVEGVVRGFVLQENFLEVLAGVFVVAVVEKRDGVVVPLFVAFKAGGALGDLGDASGDVHADAVGEVVWGGVEHQDESRVRLLVLAGLHELEG